MVARDTVELAVEKSWSRSFAPRRLRGSPREICQSLSWDPSMSTITDTITPRRCWTGLRLTVARKCYSSPTPSSWRQTLPLRGSLVPAQDLRAPRREHHYCWHQTLPLRGSLDPAKSSARLQLCLHLSEECLARRWTITAPTTLFSGARVVEARVWESVARG